MKKALLVGLALILGTVLSGCNLSQIFGGNGAKYPIAEQQCIDNNGEVTTDYEGTPICLFSANEWCPLAAIEEGDCFFIPSPGGEWISVVIDMCEEEGGTFEEWYEGGEVQYVCFFPDESFCYLEDLAAGSCKKGDMKYYDEDGLYPYAEQACIDNNGQISQTEDGEDICILNDEYFCYMSDVMDGGCDLLYQDMLDIQDMHESEGAYQQYVAECYEQPQITVCGEDGNPYYNRCFMEKAGVKEETELAEVVDGECIYGSVIQIFIKNNLALNP